MIAAIAGLFLAHAGSAYVQADLDALAKRGVWAEWVSHVDDIPPRERGDAWLGHVSRNATAAIEALKQQRGSDEALESAEHLLNLSPELEKNRELMNLRAALGVRRMRSYIEGGACDARCADWAARFMARDPGNAIAAWSFAITLRRSGEAWAALHLFRSALQKPDATRKCDDGDVLEAVRVTGGRPRGDDEFQARTVDDLKALLNSCGKPVRSALLESFASAGVDSQKLRCAALEGQKDLGAPVVETCNFVKTKK